ncbi:hypothetical protein [Methanotorris formicicus]|uniref:Uncharacterized protein n=1 Tax=Methanotorris formicicus Mc-S-70 TaxID=647171 RepID=H1KYG3_9EURY|nr:hypothetical protein [Methanotorris formicicus]EHP87078.1 hypothetical protein MetfoDRAFT_0836 [Methanotorris formicicus Mc-S-70]
MEDMDNQIIEMPIPPGLPQSIIARLLEMCNVKFDIRTDEIHDVKYPVLCGTLEDLKIAKEYLELTTETKLALREIARLARKFKTKVKLYTNDDEYKYILEIIANDIANKDKIEVVEKEPEGEYETVKVLDKEIKVYI